MNDPLYQTNPPHRPGVVTFIGIILYVQGFLAAVAGIALLIWRDEVLDHLEQEGAPLSDGALTGTIIGEMVAAVLLLIVASGIMRGSSTLRIFVVAVQVLAMALAVYTLIAHHAGGYVYRAVFTLAVGTFVLWALYGNDESDRYFRSTP